MSATHRNRAKRTVVNGIAVSAVASLTALTAGIAPAIAEPDDSGSGPSTTIAVPEIPVVEEAPVEEAPAEAPQAPPTQVAPAPVEPAPAPVPVEPAPAPVPVEPAPAPRSEAPAPPPRSSEPGSAPRSAPSTPSQAPEAEPSTPSSAPRNSSTPSTVTSAPEAPESSETPSSGESSSSSESSESSGSSRSGTPSSGESSSSSESSESGSSGESSSSETSGSSETSPSESGESSSESSESNGSSESGTTGESTGESSAESGSEATPREIVTEIPQTLEAPEEDVKIALSAEATEEKPAPATEEQVQEIADTLQLASLRRDINPEDNRPDFVPEQRQGRDWDSDVRQWDPDWVVYDEYYRPVISNPYRQPVKIIYVYQNTPRVVIINPLQRVVLEVAQYAAYSFTAVVANTINTAVNTAAAVAVGSFFGGGYFPGYGAPLPPPPPPVLRYDNVPVQVRYSNATYEPFRVQRIVDVGQDTVYGSRKVLLDGVTPAWGEWTQTPTGERMFEINKTQQFPGLEEPSEAPLPGDYKLRLASDEAAPGMDSKTLYMIIAAGVLAAMSVGAVVWSMMLGRRRTPLA